MAISFVNDSASISTTEYSLPADTTSGVPTAQTDDCVLQAWIDFGNMVAGDQYEVKVYEKVNGGTARVVERATVTGAQTEPYITASLIVGDGWDVTVKRLAGSDRTIAWSLRKVT